MSYLALYRKYRPQSFTDIIGQEHVVKTLQNALKSEKVAHAYLFCGPRGVGKTTIARLLAKAINCEKLKLNKGVEACDKCEFCQEINENKAIDIIEIDAASNRGIDEIRELKEKIKFTPNHLKYKVFIIDEVHMLTIEAFNALLKTLEEPPAHAIFILATTEVHKIPATILSRCQRFDFKKLTQKEIVNQLVDIANKEKVKIDERSLNLLASNASGSSRDALSLLNQLVSLEDSKITFEETKSILGIPDLSQVLDFIDYLITKDVKNAIKLISDISDSGYDLKQFFKNLLEYFRKLLLAKVDKSLISTEGIDLTKEQLDKLEKQSEKLTPRELVTYIGNFIRTKKEIDDNIIPQLPLEIATIESIGANNQESNYQPVENNIHNIKKNNSISNNNKTEDFKNKKTVKYSQKENKSKKETNNVKLLDPKMISNIRNDWSIFIEGVSKKNYTLGSFLKVCDPLDIQEGKIVLVCKYSFHKEKLRDFKNKQIMEDEAQKLFKAKVLFDLILYKDLSDDLRTKIDNNKSEKTKLATPDLAKQALNVFGGSTI